MTTPNSSLESLKDNFREQTVKAAQTAKALQAKAEEAKRVCKVLEELISFLDRKWFLHILALIDKEDPLLKRMKADDHPAISLVEEIHQIATEKAGELKSYRFPAYLEEACHTAGLPIDRDCRHPHYKFERGFFQLNVDDHKRIARLSNYESPKLCEFPADIGAIIEAVQREYKRVFGRSQDSRSFLRKLRSQYLSVVKKEKRPDGSSIPIRHITRRLGKNTNGFRTDEFLIDLSRLIEHETTEIDGYQLEFQQTKDAEQGMLLPGAIGQGYIGFILFKKV